MATECTRLCVESADGTVFEVTRQQAHMSGLLLSCLEDDHEGAIPLARVSAAQLRTIVAYLGVAETEGGEPSISKPLPVDTRTLSMVVPACFASLIDELPEEDLSKLLIAADYMQINGLIALCAAKIALLLKTMSEREITKFFGMEPKSEAGVEAGEAGASAGEAK